MPIKDKDAATYRYNWPYLGPYSGPVWVIQYNIDRDHYLAYSDNNLRHIQFFPVSTSLRYAGMT